MAKQTFTSGQVLTAAQVNALQTNDFNQTVSTKTDNYTLVVGDRGTRIVMNASTSKAITVNTGIFDAGDTVFIHNIGTGVVTVTAGTATINTAQSLALNQWEGGTLYFTSASSAIFWGAGAGDITGVTAGTGLSGGGSSGSVTLSFDYRAGSALTLNAQTATYTAVLTDADQKLVTMSVASANNFQIPTNASVAFPVGTVLNVIQIGAGQTTIQAVTSGTTTISSTGATATAPKLRAQYSAASCIKVATDTWYVVGDIA